MSGITLGRIDSGASKTLARALCAVMLLWLFASQPAFAQFCPQNQFTWYYTNGDVSTKSVDVQTACNRSKPPDTACGTGVSVATTYTAMEPTWTSYVVNGFPYYSGKCNYQGERVWCNGNTTELTPVTAQVPLSYTCEEEDGPCAERAGEEITGFIPQGYDDSPNPAADSKFAKMIINVDTAFCDSVCIQQVGEPVDNGAGQLNCITDNEPGSTGFYLTRCEYTITNLGKECDFAPDAKHISEMLQPPNPPDCDGTLGAVNGKTVCLSDKTTDATPTDSGGEPETDEQRHTNDPDGGGRVGGEDGVPETDQDGAPLDGDGDGHPDGVDDAPSGGGQSRTSGEGTGSSSGGGDDGGSGSGSGEGGGEDTCGGPGLPPCDVRIDETGTPTDVPDQTALVNSARDDWIGALGELPEPDLSGWSWLPTLPSGSCSPLTLEWRGQSESYDWCSDLEIFRLFWIAFVALSSAVYVWRRASAAVEGVT